MAKISLAFPKLLQTKEVVYGTGSLRTILDPEILSNSVIFLSGNSNVRDYLFNNLKKRGVDLSEEQCFIKCTGEPDEDMIKLGSKLIKERLPKIVIAIGGGSVLDLARLSWLFAESRLDIENGHVLPCERTHNRPRFWLVPTTCGTGAEATTVAVYTYKKRKVASVSQEYLAERVVLDGRFLTSMSEGDLAGFLSDALSHAIESNLSIVPATLAKVMGQTCLRIILSEYNRREGTSDNDLLMQAGFLGGIAASHCSVGIIHAFAHSLSIFGIGHSLGNAYGLAAGIRFNIETKQMRCLLTSICMKDVDELIDEIRKIVRVALSQDKITMLQELLSDANVRCKIHEGILSDIAVRSNPIVVDSDGAKRYLKYIEEELQLL
jgi:alcohol dehydrogenase class IV